MPGEERQVFEDPQIVKREPREEVILVSLYLLWKETVLSSEPVNFLLLHLRKIRTAVWVQPTVLSHFPTLF